MPACVTDIEDKVLPVLQTPPLFPVKLTEPPAQKLGLPCAEIVAAIGNGLTLTDIAFEVTLPHELVVVTE